MQFAGENLRDWLASLSHNVTDLSNKSAGLVSTFREEDTPETGGSIDYVPDGPGERPDTDTYNEYLDERIKKIKDLDRDRWKKKEEEEVDPADPVDPVDPVDPDPTDPEDEKTDGRKFTEKLYGEGSLTDEELTWRMKANPATTPEDWARAFGKCRTTTSSDKHASIPSDCYWPEEGGLEGSDFYSVGKGGGTAHAKAGQAASRNRAAAARNMSAREGKRRATRSQSKPGK